MTQKYFRFSTSFLIIIVFLNSTYAQQSRAKTQAELDAKADCNLKGLTLSGGMGGYISHFLCQTYNLAKTDGKFTPEAVTLYINALEKAIQDNATLQGYAFTFPTDKTAIINAIINSDGDCVKLNDVAQTLVAGITGTIKIEDFNNTILPTYSDVLEQVIKETIDMKNIEFYEIKDEKRLDENKNACCSLYPTYEAENLIKKGAKWYYAGDGKNHSLKIQVKPSQKVTDLDLKVVEETANISNLQTAKNPATFTLIAKVKEGQNLTINKIQGKDRTKEPIINGLNVIACKAKKIPVNIYLLKDKNHNFTIDRTLIETEVKNLFLSIAGITTIQFIEQEVDYKTIDKNGNGQVDKEDLVASSESNSLSNILPDLKVPAFKVVIVDLPIRSPKLTEEQTIGGYASRSFKIELDDYQNIGENVVISTKVPDKSSIASSISHELGHFIFGLRHPFEQFAGFSQGTDALNIMDYPQGVFPLWSERIFRAYQVKLIENGTTKR